MVSEYALGRARGDAERPDLTMPAMVAPPVQRC